jgi:hypothetical protein
MGLLWRSLVGSRPSAMRLSISLAAVLLYLAVTVGQTLAATAVSDAQTSFHNSAWHMFALPAVALAAWPAVTRLRIARGYLIVALAVTGYAVVRLIIGPAGAEKENALALAPILQLPSGDLGLFGSTTGRQQLAAWSGLAVPFAAAMVLWGSGKWRLVALASVAVGSVALIGTQTRVGLIGAFVGLAAVTALFVSARAFPGLRFEGAALSLAAVLVAFAVGFTVTSSGSSNVGNRYAAILDPQEDPSFGARTETWRITIDNIKDRPFGYGVGSAGGVGRARAARVRPIGLTGATTGANAIDNSYLKIGYEQGALVMLLFLTAVILVAGALARTAVASASGLDAGLAIACCGAFVSFAVNLLLTDNIEDYTALTAWVLAGLGLASLASSDGGSGRFEIPAPRIGT